MRGSHGCAGSLRIAIGIGGGQELTPGPLSPGIKPRIRLRNWMSPGCWWQLPGPLDLLPQPQVFQGSWKG